MTEREERAFGIRLARKYRLPKTVQSVQDSSSCYRDIMRTIAEEAGIEKATALIAEAKDLKWAYHFAFNVQGLSEEQNTALITIIAEATSPKWAYHFCYVRGLTEEQNTDLITIVAEAKDPEWAYRFARNVQGLTKEQRDELSAIA